MTDSMPSATAAADAVRNREQSAVELTEQCLDAIAKHNPELNAFVHLDADGALEAAKRIDARVAAGEDPGPLAGVPFGVKDLDDCAGMPTTHGSRWYLGRPPVATDALHVARLRAAGAIPLGKTAAGRDAQPVEPRTDAGWVVGRLGRGDRGGHGAVRDVERRRWLDAHARR